MKTTKRMAIFLAFLAAACGGSSSNPVAELQAATPDVAGLSLETTGGAADGLTVSPAGSALAASAAAASGCEPYQYLCNIHAAVTGLNEYVQAAVEPIEDLAQTTPTSVEGNVAVFGPVGYPAGTAGADFRLTVAKVAEGSFQWKLEGKPLGGADSSYLLVAAGRIVRATGDLPHRGHGSLGIDLDALYQLNPATGPAVFPGEGKLLLGFGHSGEAKAVLYALDKFSPDRVADPNPVSGILAGWKSAAGLTRVRIVSVGEYLGAPNGGADAGDETLLGRAGWFPGVGGRAAVVLTGGDVPAYGVDFFLGLSCFDESQSDVYRALYGCTAGVCTLVANAPAGFNVGSPSACDPATDIGIDEKIPPSTSTTDPGMEPGAPAVPDLPPASMQSLSF